MRTVGELLKMKGREVWSISPQESVYRALEIMAEKDIGALLVIEDGILVGIFSERDYARKVILRARSSKDTSVGELMTQAVVCADAGDTLEDCMASMTEKKIRHLPVLERGRLKGIVTLGDVVKRIISEQEFTIHQLESFVTSGEG